MGLVKYGWIMCSAVVASLSCLTVVLIHWEATTVIILMTPVCSALGVLAPMVTSDFKAAMPLVDVWRSASTTSGAQCAMTSGVLQMHKLFVGSWDFQVLRS